MRDHTPTHKYYQTDLAFVHDKGYAQVAQNAAKTIKSLMTEISQGLLIDLGCGSGTLEKELEDTPLKLIGVDYSDDMINLARKHVPHAEFITSSMYDYKIPKCDLVCSVGECLNYLFANDGGLDELNTLVSRIYNALNPGGYFVFDILTTDYLQSSKHGSRIIEEEQWTMFLSIEVNEIQSILTRTIILFKKIEGGHYNKSTEVHLQKMYDKNDVEAILTDVGFQVSTIDGYDTHAFREGQTGFICKKQ